MIDVESLPVVCNPVTFGRDPTAAEPELVWPCRECETKVYVKRAFIEMGGIRVVCWECFRDAGNRCVLLHPEMVAELKRAGRYEDALVAIKEIEDWLREPDEQNATASHRWEGLRSSMKLKGAV